MRWRSVIKELMRGKSVARALLAGEVAATSLKGEYIDLGSKDGWGAQYRHMNVDEASITYTDFVPRNDGTVQVNVEEPFSDKLPTYDGVLMFFLLEHVYRFQHVLAESRKIVRPGGQLVGAVPQIAAYHADPDDYFRFTRSALRRSLEEAGWSDVVITPAGIGPMSVAAEMFNRFARFRVIKVPVALTGMSIDLLATKLGGTSLRERYAITHLFRATNPGDS